MGADPRTILRRKPTFLMGLASIWDFSGLLRYGNAPSDHDADSHALWLDWQAVGDDMWTAMGQFEDETGIRILENYRSKESVSRT